MISQQQEDRWSSMPRSPSSSPVDAAANAPLRGENHPLKTKIESFRSQGWINVFQEREYLQLLSMDQSEHTGENSVRANDDPKQKVEQLLDLIERKKKEDEGEKEDVSSTYATNGIGADVEITDVDATDDGIGISKNDKSPDNRDESETNAVNCISKEPLSDHHQQFKSISTPEEVANKLDRKQMEDLFVEMCFFARLGFLQPPTCLRCSYRASGAENDKSSSVKASPPVKGCNRLVMWRRDANLSIHPDRMQSNSIIVTCQTAQEWMTGETVRSWKWDREARCLSSTA